MTFHSILVSISEKYLWFLLLIVILNMTQKKYLPRSSKKRIATLILASLTLGFEVLLTVILAQGLPDWTVFIALGLVLVGGFLLRRKCWPFRLHCPRCKKSLKWGEIIGSDDNICDECYRKEHPELFIEEEPEVPAIPTCVGDIDWDNWEAEHKCVITYLFRTTSEGIRQVLLIDKKTGLGNGLVNVPGGHIEDDETAKEAAIREFKEETGVSITNPEEVGSLNFQFLDGTTLSGHVFFCQIFEGDIKETEEARGFWCPVSEIPYERMWEDDRYWLPEALDGKTFELFSVFDQRRMVSLRNCFRAK